MDSLDSFEIKEITDPSKARKNPYIENIKKNGFSITVHYSPEDVIEILSGKQKFDFDILEHDPDELEAFERYKKANDNK